MIAYRDR